MQQEISIRAITHDPYLVALFQQLESTHETCVDNKFEQPQKYDQKDIQRDYQSECMSLRHGRKSKKIMNKVLRNNKRRKQKLYVQMLENRVFNFQKQVQSLKKLNSINREYIRKFEETGHVVNGFFINRQRHYEKLMAYIRQEEADQSKYMEELTALRMRQGALGKERVKIINYYFKELAEIILPDLQKYIFKTVEEESDLFDPHFIKYGTLAASGEQWRKDMLQDLQLTPDKIGKICLIRDSLVREKQHFAKDFNEFYNYKCKLMASARNMEQIYDRLHSILTPRQTAKCLCLLEKYKFEKGFSIEELMKSTFGRLKEEESQSYNPNNPFAG